MRPDLGWALVAALLAVGVSAAEEPLTQVPASIRVVTTVSAGTLTPAEVVAKAEAEGVRVLVITDQLLTRAEYGLWPLRRLLRRVMERPSVLTYGPERYLNELAELDRQHPGVLVIAGLDVSPHYYWQGSPLARDLAVRQWSEQMTVIGLTDPEALRLAPLVANPHLGRFLGSPLMLIGPLAALVVAGTVSWRVRYGFTVNQRLLRPVALLAVVVSVLFLVNNFPYDSPGPSPYAGDPGVGPYQDFIDYGRGRGALVFWSHPEMTMQATISGVELLTRPYTDHVRQSRGATGLAVVYGDARRAHLPGELWDVLLGEYARGERAEPTWGIGEVDFHGGPVDRRGEPASFRQVETVLMLHEVSADDVVEALGSGRCYARAGRRGRRLCLNEFVASDAASGEEARSGQELRSRGRVSVVAEGSTEQGPETLPGRRLAGGRQGTVTLVRNGQVVRKEPFQENFQIRLSEDLPGGLNWYRVLVEHPDSGELVSNPIFVRAPQGDAGVRRGESGRKEQP